MNVWEQTRNVKNRTSWDGPAQNISSDVVSVRLHRVASVLVGIVSIALIRQNPIAAIAKK